MAVDDAWEAAVCGCDDAWAVVAAFEALATSVFEGDVLAVVFFDEGAGFSEFEGGSDSAHEVRFFVRVSGWSADSSHELWKREKKGVRERKLDD